MTTTTSTTVSNSSTTSVSKSAKPPSKLDQIEKLLTRKNGATITEMMQMTGWQQHSIRGALAGSLKKRGLTISSEKSNGTRRYRAQMPV